MPLTVLGQPVEISISLRDLDGNIRPATAKFPGTVTVADLITNLAAIEAAIAAMSNAAVVGGTITVKLGQDPPPAAPPESSDVERKASVVYKTEAGTYAKFEIPSVDPALVVDGGNLINRQSAAFIAYNTFMLNGYPGAANGPVTGAGDSLTELFSAKKIHRASSKG